MNPRSFAFVYLYLSRGGMAESSDNSSLGLASLPPISEIHSQGRDRQRDAGGEDEERASSMFAVTNKVGRRRNGSENFDLFLQCVASR